MNRKKYLNVKVCVEIYNMLINMPYHGRKWKTISASIYLLTLISEWNKKQNKWSRMGYKKICDIYKPYTKSSEYLPYIKELEECGLLEIGWGSERRGSQTRKYHTTEKAVHLLSNGATEYLKKLHGDKTLRRQIQKSISNRKVMHKTYDDSILNYLYDGLIHMTYEEKKAETFINNAMYSDETALHARLSLADFKHKNFSELHYNPGDSRISTEWLRMKSDLRQFFHYKNMDLVAVIDFRACHISLFGKHLQDLHPEITDESFHANCNDWTRRFLGKKDPRIEIAKELNITLKECKDGFNMILNGEKKHTRLLKWIETHYPSMYAVWKSGIVKQTGPTISRNYETKLMLDESLFRLADSLGVKIMYEYDGFSVFSTEKSKSKIKSIVDTLNTHIKKQSLKLFGVSVVIKSEYITHSLLPPTILHLHCDNTDNHVDDDFFYAYKKHQIDLLYERLEDAKEKCDRSRRKAFGKNTPESWKSFRRHKDNMLTVATKLDTMVAEYENRE